MDIKRYNKIQHLSYHSHVSFAQREPDSDQVMDAIDIIDAHMLPFFSSKASTGRCDNLIVLFDVYLPALFQRVHLGQLLQLISTGSLTMDKARRYI